MSDSNKFTLNIDGNYMLQRILGIAAKDFTGDSVKDRKILVEKLAFHVAYHVRESIGFIDNVVLVKDGRSWRKDVELVRPKTGFGSAEGLIGYKENRDQQERIQLDWTMIFETLDLFGSALESQFGVPFFNVWGAEGDDLLWLLTRYQRANSVKSLIYCTDSDLNQLVTDKTIVHRQVRSNAHPSGEIVVHNRWWNLREKALANETIFNVDLLAEQVNNELFGSRTIGSGLTAVNPIELVFYKCIMGDAKDNVPPLFSWKSANGKQNRYINVKHIWAAMLKVDPSYNFYEMFEHDALYDEIKIKKFIEALMIETKQRHDLDHTFKVYKSNRKVLYLNAAEIPKDLQQSMTKLAIDKKEMRADLTKLSEADNILSAMGQVRSTSIFSSDLYETNTKHQVSNEPAESIDQKFSVDSDFFNQLMGQ